MRSEAGHTLTSFIHVHKKVKPMPSLYCGLKQNTIVHIELLTFSSYSGCKYLQSSHSIHAQIIALCIINIQLMLCDKIVSCSGKTLILQSKVVLLIALQRNSNLPPHFQLKHHLFHFFIASVFSVNIH